MASVNKAILVGHLGRDPETRYLPDGGAITNVSLATSDSWKDKTTGERKEQTEWHRVVFFGRLAEIAGEYLKKGSLVYVEGALRTRKWQDKDGNERYTTEVRADTMQMLGGRNGAGQDGHEQPAARAPARKQQQQPELSERRQPAAAGGGGHFDDMEDDIPF